MSSVAAEPTVPRCRHLLCPVCYRHGPHLRVPWHLGVMENCLGLPGENSKGLLPSGKEAEPGPWVGSGVVNRSAAVEPWVHDVPWEQGEFGGWKSNHATCWVVEMVTWSHQSA